jgi:hypothetical protein
MGYRETLFLFTERSETGSVRIITLLWGIATCICYTKCGMMSVWYNYQKMSSRPNDNMNYPIFEPFTRS